MKKYKNDIFNFLFVLVVGFGCGVAHRYFAYFFVGFFALLVTYHSAQQVLMLNKDEVLRKRVNAAFIPTPVVVRQFVVVMVAVCIVLICVYFVFPDSVLEVLL